MEHKGKRLGGLALAGAGISALVVPLALTGAAAASPDKDAERGRAALVDRADSKRPDQGDRQTRRDPRGANGTVKIDGLPLQPGMRNEPHVRCGFAIEFFNFDAGQRADITITAQSPSGPRTATVMRQRGVVISTDAAGGGRPDPDASLRYDVSKLNLAKLTAHPKQGYHVRVTVRVHGAPGAGKHKVFWVKDCTKRTAPPQATPPKKSTPPKKNTPPKNATPPKKNTPPVVPSGPVDAGLGGGSGSAAQMQAPTAASMPVLLFAGAAVLGLGLALGLGRYLMVLRRRA